MSDKNRGTVFNIQRYSVHDGPGIRTIVFLQGCPLHCPWCANPEGQSFTSVLSHNQNLCRQCGRCVDVCPMELSPLYFVKYAKEENWQGMKDMNVMDCVECRCCQYICSSKIPIINSIKAGKGAVRGMK